MLFKFTNKTKERDRPIIRWRIGGGIVWDGDDEGGLPVKRYQASGDENTTEQGGNIMMSKMAVFDSSLEIFHQMPFSVQRSSSRQGKSGEKGGMEKERGRGIVTNEFSHWALPRSDSIREPSNDRVGWICGFTKDQSLEGAE